METYPAELIEVLQRGGVAVLRTDTIYGLVGRADSQEIVERIYAIKGRSPEKSPIVLISESSDMFDRYDAATYQLLDSYWPGPNSVIVPSLHGPDWITRGNASIAYRLPAPAHLQALIRAVGPLAAPSANPEALPPALSIQEARTYFGDRVDYYHDGGVVTDPHPSSLFRYVDGSLTQLR